MSIHIKVLGCDPKDCVLHSYALATHPGLKFSGESVPFQLSCAARLLTKEAFHCHRYIIGAYEAKTAEYVSKRSIMGVWPKTVLQALALNLEADRNGGRYFIPVFGGDFNEHLVVHASPTQDDFMLHAATHSGLEGAEMAVRYMRYLLEQSRDAALAGLQGDLQMPADLSC